MVKAGMTLMAKYEVNGNWYSVAELSERSGIPPHTIRDRLRRGYTVEEAVKPVATHESVKEFCGASLYSDWIGMPIDDLYKIYWQWCIKNGYTAIQKQGFSRQIMGMYPVLKTVPTKRGNKCCRVIRKRV